MKLKRTILAISTIAATGAVATSVMTSCSGVSQTIIDNLVTRGDGTKFGSWTGTNATGAFSLDNAIHAALTDKNSVASFKKAVVNDILYVWYKHRVDGSSGITQNTSYNNNWDQWNKQVNDDYDGKVQNYKNQHNSNWPYYFQNEVLDPAGGTKDAYIYQQLCEKIRSDFISHVWETTLLGVPSSGNTSITSPDTVARNFDLSPANNFGMGTYSSPDILSKNRWQYIKFSPYVNVKYTDTDPQQTYANFFTTLQQEALDMYFVRNHPVASSMALWSYKAPTGGLVKIYNGDIIPAQNTSSSSDGKVGDGKPLDSPSYSFPYFEISHDPNTKGPNEKFQEFAQDFNSTTNYYNDKGFGGSSSATDSLGLTNISTDFSDDSQPSVFLLSQSNGTNNAFETFAPEILNLYHNQSTTAETLPVNVINPNSYLTGSMTNAGTTFTYNNPDIMKNFLFTGKDGENPLPSTSNAFTTPSDLQNAYFKNVTYGNGSTPTWGYTVGSTGPGAYTNLLPNAVIDLASIFENDTSIHNTDAQVGNGNNDHIKIFNEQSDWYKKGYRYLVSGVRMAKDPTGSTPVTLTDALPRYLIRNAKGVHSEGLYGAPMLAVADNDAKLTAEYQLLLYRTIYEKNCTTAPMGKGLNIVDGDSTTDGAKVFFTANTDDVILKAIYDSKTSSPANSPWLEIFTNNDNKISEDQFDKLYELTKATYVYFWMQDIITNYDAANKKLYAWGATYATNNEFMDPNRHLGDPNVIETIYNNGLAQALPIAVKTGVKPSAANINSKYFVPDAKTYYQVNYDNMLTDFESSSTYLTPIQDVNTTSLQTLAGYISDKYNTYTLTNVVSPFLPGSYSEHILTNNVYVNSLLQTFGGGSAFSNSVKSAAYFGYLANKDNNNFFNYLDGSTELQNAIISQYLVGQMLKDNKLSYYMNAGTGTNGAMTLNDFTSGIYSNWQYQNTLDSGFDSNVNTNGTGDKKISYWNLLASIKYLSANNYANFFKSLNSALATNDAHDYSNPAYIAWTAIENTKFDPTFATETDMGKVYGWKYNYNNTMENFYTNTNVLSTNINSAKTYAENKQYYNFANMPTSGVNVVNAMGFAGIVTKNSHATLPDAVGTALFTRTKDATAGISQNGELHKYGFNTAADFKSWVDSAANSWVATDIDNMATDIDNSIIGFGETLEHIKNVTSAQDKAAALLGPSGGTYGVDNLVGNNTINDAMFIPYNLKQTGSTGHANQATFELNDPNNDTSPFIKDAPGVYQGSRMRAEQISYADVNPTTPSATRWQDFCDTYGTSVAYTLLVQFANQSNNLNEAERDVITYIFGAGSGAVVYDRRLNDLLGKNWVKDWKETN